ncbi:hypothetical protein CGJ15_24430 [Vibrio parahaemolyticus]|nr:hypothetical protein CGJ15_24430 [Vibrio parahaemolyticus]
MFGERSALWLDPRKGGGEIIIHPELKVLHQHQSTTFSCNDPADQNIKKRESHFCLLYIFEFDEKLLIAALIERHKMLPF